MRLCDQQSQLQLPSSTTEQRGSQGTLWDDGHGPCADKTLLTKPSKGQQLLQSLAQHYLVLVHISIMTRAV